MYKSMQAFSHHRDRQLGFTIQEHPADSLYVIMNTDGVILDMNDAFAAQTALSSEDLKGRKIFDTIFLKNYDSLTSLPIGEQVILFAGSDTPHHFYFDHLQGQDGQPYIVGSTLGEVTEDTDWQALLPSAALLQDQKKSPAAKTATLKNQDLQIFTTINIDLMCVLDQSGTILRHNQSLAKIAGAGNSFIDIVHVDDRTSARQAIHALADDDHSGDRIILETRLKSDTDETLWVEWHFSMTGEHIYCLGHDMTEAKKNEIALLRREKELSEAQALANMGHWRWVVGSDVIEWSDQLYTIFGVDRNSFQPTIDNVNALLHRRDLGRMMQAFQHAIIQQNEYDIDFRVMKSDGSVGYIRCEGRCEIDEDGDVIALYGVMQDVSDQTKYAMELKEAKDAAEQAYASKSRFLANMSHELRTPLNAIIGFSDMIERQMLGAIGNDKYVEYAGSIRQSGQHLLSLITDILDMSKIEAGKYELDLETVQLGSIAKTAIRMIESRAQEGIITLVNLIKDDGPTIIADRRAVMQILLNILSNAVKFTEPGGEITIGIESYDHHVSVRISDTGIGIPANKLSAVLRPFEQVSSEFTRNHEGSGLGLSITKELIELHGGSLVLESKENQGTTASIRLPWNASEKTDA